MDVFQRRVALIFQLRVTPRLKAVGCHPHITKDCSPHKWQGVDSWAMHGMAGAKRLFSFFLACMTMLSCSVQVQHPLWLVLLPYFVWLSMRILLDIVVHHSGQTESSHVAYSALVSVPLLRVAFWWKFHEQWKTRKSDLIF